MNSEPFISENLADVDVPEPVLRCFSVRIDTADGKITRQTEYRAVNACQAITEALHECEALFGDNPDVGFSFQVKFKGVCDAQ